MIKEHWKIQFRNPEKGAEWQDFTDSPNDFDVALLRLARLTNSPYYEYRIRNEETGEIIPGALLT